MSSVEREFKQVTRQKIVDRSRHPCRRTRPAMFDLPGVKGKAMAVIGMRRSGKTTFLWQCLADRLKSGTPRDALLYFTSRMNDWRK